MSRKRVKKCNGTEKDNNSSEYDVGLDRISELPDPVIHHILSFARTVDAVRMSLLSKRWRRVWHSVPTLQLPYKAGFEEKKAFNVFVVKCLKHRRRAMRFVDGSSVTILKLDAFPDRSREWLSGLTKWFGSSVIMNNLKELDLWLCPEDDNDDPKRYSLPFAVLNSKSLTHVKLVGFLTMSASCSVNLPSLKSLCLKNVRIDGESLYNFIIGCPSLEKCILDQFFHVDNLRISSSSLRFLEIDAECETVEIEARNLQSLDLNCGCGAELDFESCRAIRDLKLYDLCYFQGWNSEDQISKLPLLENLTLYPCDDCERINIT